MAFHYSPKLITRGMSFCSDPANNKSWNENSTDRSYNLFSNESYDRLINGVLWEPDNLGQFSYDGVNDYSRIVGYNINPTNSFTINIWINPTQTSTIAYLVSKHTLSGNNLLAAEQDWLCFFRNNGNIEFRPSDGTSINQCVTPDGTVQWLEWQQITYSLDIENAKLTIHHNGIQVAQTTLTITVPDSNRILNTGFKAWGTHGWLEALVGPIHVHNVVLSTEEILQNYNALKTRFGL